MNLENSKLGNLNTTILDCQCKLPSRALAAQIRLAIFSNYGSSNAQVRLEDVSRLGAAVGEKHLEM
jgi:hypothetical protein